jgi:hypothetical protein
MWPFLGNGMLKNVSAATNMQATIEELLEVMFSVWFMPWLYNENLQVSHCFEIVAS